LIIKYLDIYVPNEIPNKKIDIEIVVEKVVIPII
jgi:hypothetical protein